MKCQVCQTEEAKIHLTQVVNGVAKTLHLCEQCARKSGLNLSDPTSLNEVLLGLGQPSEQPAEPGTTGTQAERVCPHCHLSFSEFRKTGRLGCPECYRAFQTELEPLIRQMHRRDRHVGRRPPNWTEPTVTTEELDRLQKELQRAVAEERYEDAAQLRDRLAELRRILNQAEPGASSNS
jgi:protein arginine kinase activator